MITGHIPLFLEELFKGHSSPSILAVQSWAAKINAEIFQDKKKVSNDNMLAIKFLLMKFILDHIYTAHWSSEKNRDEIT